MSSILTLQKRMLLQTEARVGEELTASDFGGTGGGALTVVTTVPRDPSIEEEEWKEMRFGSFPRPSAF